MISRRPSWPYLLVLDPLCNQPGRLLGWSAVLTCAMLVSAVILRSTDRLHRFFSSAPIQ